MACLIPTRRLKRVDLPTLGRPTIAKILISGAKVNNNCKPANYSSEEPQEHDEQEFPFFQRIFSSVLAHLRPSFLISLLWPISVSGNFPFFLKMMLKDISATQIATTMMESIISDILN
jgi:uncharacterized protein YqhQ